MDIGSKVSCSTQISVSDLSHSTFSIRKLSERNIVRLLFAFAIDWSVIVGLFALGYQIHNPLCWILVWFLLGTRQHAIGVLGHEGTHLRAHKTQWINDLVCNVLCFWPMGFDIKGFRRFHLEHHRNPNASTDPELKIKRVVYPIYELPLPRRKVRGAFLCALVGSGIPELIAFASLARPRNWKEIAGPVSFWIIALSLMFSTHTLWIAAVWLLCNLTSYWAVFRIRIYTEHIAIEGTHRTSAKWWQRFLFLPNNIGYHYEHHKWPSIPYWNLPRVRKLDSSTPVLSLEQLFNRFQQSAIAADVSSVPYPR